MWNLTNCKLKTNHIGHTGYLNCVTVSPDGSLCASGGKVSFKRRRILPVNHHLQSACWFIKLYNFIFRKTITLIYCLCAATTRWIKTTVLMLNRMDKPCCGIWTKASTCTHWMEAMSSIHCASAPTDTGCVLPQDLASKFGYVETCTRFTSRDNCLLFA